MVDLEPFLEAPFEEASNVSFEVLLLTGWCLLAAVAVLGRSTVTAGAVAVYLLLIPTYVGYRIRVWERDGSSGDDGGTVAETGSEDDTAAETSDDGDAAAGTGNDGDDELPDATSGGGGDTSG